MLFTSVIKCLSFCFKLSSIAGNLVQVTVGWGVKAKRQYTCQVLSVESAGENKMENIKYLRRLWQDEVKAVSKNIKNVFLLESLKQKLLFLFSVL